MRRNLVYILALLIIISAFNKVEAKQTVTGSLVQATSIDPVKVIDGDTFEIDHIRIRLWGIDAPELHQTCYFNEQSIKCGQAAKVALMSVLKMGTLACTKKARDRYQRNVDQCTVDGKDVAGLLVLSGWALDYPQYSKGYYNQYESEARQDKRGVWKLNFVRPSLWRKGVRQYH